MLSSDMVDFNDIVKNKQQYLDACKNKNANVDIEVVVEIGNKKRELQREIEDLRRQGNEITSEIKSVQGKPPQDLIEKGREVKEKLKPLEEQFQQAEIEFNALILKVPNLPSADTPIGKDESENVVIRKWGTPRDFAKEGFEPREHWELGPELGVLDLERAAKVSGARFAYLMGDLALLQFALVQLTFEKLTDEKFIAEIISEKKLNIKTKAFIPVVPPVIIKPEPFQRMARLEPREERYHLPQDDQYLIGSAEHTLGAMFMDETLDEAQLPIRFIGYSTAFRREAGSYGKDTKGILRVHQFDKLEMEAFSTPETSLDEQNLFVGIQEKLMQALEIPYQVMAICTGDMGGPDARQFDIEAWMPGQNKYRETHTADLMTDYQARRLNTRVKREDGEKDLVHMNDATAFAVGRTLIAIMENYQQKDGSIAIPTVLQKYVGKEKITKR